MPESSRRSYEGERITVSFDAARCLHAAECVRGLPAVFDAKRRPWIDPDGADAEQTADVVRRCPSGALRYELRDGEPERGDVPASVRSREGGGLELRGELRIETPDGELSETRVVLCDCGRTARAPFCDNACRAG
jgi:uncharacterized Fe-S cluster protein YjdI